MSTSAPNGSLILLAHSYYLRADEKQWRKMKPYPPLATLFAASVLRTRGHAVRLFDAMLADGVEDFRRLMRDVRPAIVAVVEDNFNFLTKMCTIQMRQAACSMIRHAKAEGCRVVVNGSDATDNTYLYLEAGADAVIVGEPEHALSDLVQAWSDGPEAAVDHIPGVVVDVRPSGKVSRGQQSAPTPPRAFLEDLDAIPFPAWDLVDVERYRNAWREAHGRLSWNVVTSRGCPYRCNWCAKPTFGTRYAQRSPISSVSPRPGSRRSPGKSTPEMHAFPSPCSRA
jgi:anaerobic magnesium-protoporphyrin IX monomethyl ester cyclase